MTLDSWITALPLALSPAVISAGWSAPHGIPRETCLSSIGQMAIAWALCRPAPCPQRFSSLDRKRNEAARTLGSSAAAGDGLDRRRSHSSFDRQLSSLRFFPSPWGDVNIPLILGGGKRENAAAFAVSTHLILSLQRKPCACVALSSRCFTSIAFFLKERNHETS